MMSALKSPFSKQNEVTSRIRGNEFYCACDCCLRHCSIRVLKDSVVFANSTAKNPNQTHTIINWLATAPRLLWLIRFQISKTVSYIFWRAQVRASSHSAEAVLNRQESTADGADMLFALVNLNFFPLYSGFLNYASEISRLEMKN